MEEREKNLKLRLYLITDWSVHLNENSDLITCFHDQIISILTQKMFSKVLFVGRHNTSLQREQDEAHKEYQFQT